MRRVIIFGASEDKFNMAFGKDPNGVVGMASFRQMAAHHQAAKPKSGGNGNGAQWADRYKLSVTVDEIQILRGSYDVQTVDQNGTIENHKLPYFMHVEHYNATLKKGAICSAGPAHAFKHLRGECRGCDMFWAGKEQDKKGGPMSKRDVYSFSILHYAPYAKMEVIDKNTGDIRKDSEGKPFYAWQRMMPQERHKYQGKELRQAHLLHWPMGSNFLSTLLNYDQHIGQSCRNCGGRDSIKSDWWGCQYCNEPIIDMHSSDLPSEQIYSITNEPCRCPKCGNMGMLKEYVSCSNCDNAVRAELFDVRLKVQLSKGAQPTQNQLIVVSWSNPAPIPAQYASIAVPLDLPKIYAPDSIERQIQIWQLGDIPQHGQPAPQMYRQYEQQDMPVFPEQSAPLNGHPYFPPPPPFTPNPMAAPPTNMFHRQ